MAADPQKPRKFNPAKVKAYTVHNRDMHSHTHIYDSCKWLGRQPQQERANIQHTIHTYMCTMKFTQPSHSISKSNWSVNSILSHKMHHKVYLNTQWFTHILYTQNCNRLAITGQFMTGFPLTMTSGIRTCSVHFHLSPPTDGHHHLTQSGPIHLSEVGSQFPWQPSLDSQ